LVVAAQDHEVQGVTSAGVGEARFREYDGLSGDYAGDNAAVETGPGILQFARCKLGRDEDA
jgi:hypothetical protein